MKFITGLFLVVPYGVTGARAGAWRGWECTPCNSFWHRSGPGIDGALQAQSKKAIPKS